MSECGYLGCRPNGIVTQTIKTDKVICGVFEVKCPFKYRNNTLNEMINLELKEKKFLASLYLTKPKELNTNYPYWHQIQGEMASTNLEWNDFVIWTKKHI